VAAALGQAGAEVLTIDPDAKPWMIWAADVDLLIAGTKPGTLSHQGAPMVKARAVVPWGPIPVTTKAYLMLERAGTRVLPDFVAAAGGLVAPYLQSSGAADARAQIARQVSEILPVCAEHDEGVMMGAFVRAEDFLASWTDYSPFGRPLAA
jgi:glutamate dehydrogenase/leucine dehydrogenase